MNRLLIKPDQNLGEGIVSFMLTKAYFDKHSSEFNENTSIEDFLGSSLGLPIVWIDQVHGSKIDLVKRDSLNLLDSCD